MNNKEKAELVFASLNDGFSVEASRSTGKIDMKAVAFLQEKCVAFSPNGSGGYSAFDVSNDEIYRTKSEKICDSVSANLIDSSAVVASVESPLKFG